MEKITEPTKYDEDNCIFTEEINYFETGEKSIWGRGAKETLEILNKEGIKGKWLNLAAGDGRYNLQLLKKADQVVVSDIDASALSKLYYYTLNKYKKKLKVEVFNITKKFPFEDESFDGVFCSGTLHYFPREIFRKISQEISRVLKPQGKLIIEFATDIKRIKTDGNLLVLKREPQYTFDEGREFLRKLFENYRMKTVKGNFAEEFSEANPPYLIKCYFLIMVAIKDGKRSNSKD